MRVAAIAFLAGIFAVQQFAALPSLYWSLLLIPAVALSLIHPRWLFLLFLVGGFVWATWRADLILQEHLPPHLEGRDILVEGVVSDLPRPTDYGSQFSFDVTQARVDGQPVNVPARIRLSADRRVTVHASEAWRFTVRLKRPHGLQNPGGFDYEAYLFRHRVRATGYVRTASPFERLGEVDGVYRLQRWRDRLGNRIRDVLGESDFAGLIVALANGDGGSVTSAQWETLRRTGTLHLVAISGLHISLIAGVFFWVVRRLWSLPGFTVLWLPAQFAGAIGGLLAATAYAALAGFVIPTQRALIMLAVALGAVLLRQRPTPSRLLAAALFAVLTFDPLAVQAPGFWLSYAAVAVIIYVVHDAHGIWSLLKNFGYMQIAIAIGMVPLLLWLFQRVSLVSPIANLVAVPTFDFMVVPLTLMGAALLGVGWEGGARLVLNLADGLFNQLWRLLDILGTLDATQWVQHRPPGWTVVCGLIGVAVLLAPRGWPGRAVGVVWLLPIFLVRPALPHAGEMWFTLLDVGQGLAAVVRTENHVLVFDSGARWSERSDAGRTVVVPYLRARGVARIDTLLVSHGDIDHAGGAASILSELPVARVLSGTPDVAGEPCRAGMRWDWDGVEFTVLNPDGAQGKRNDASCVLRVRGAYASVLLPADIEAAGEEALLRRVGNRLQADVLVAPHHGSRTSSSESFIDAVHPRLVLFPVGYRNRYRHPHPSIRERYRLRGISLYDSATDGALEFYSRADGIEVAAYRERHRRYWHTAAAP